MQSVTLALRPTRARLPPPVRGALRLLTHRKEDALHEAEHNVQINVVNECRATADGAHEEEADRHRQASTLSKSRFGV